MFKSPPQTSEASNNTIYDILYIWKTTNCLDRLILLPLCFNTLLNFFKNKLVCILCLVVFLDFKIVFHNNFYMIKITKNIKHGQIAKSLFDNLYCSSVKQFNLLPPENHFPTCCRNIWTEQEQRFSPKYIWK